MTVTDDDSAAGVGQGTVIVQSPQQTTQVLVTTITNLVTTSVLAPGNGNALSATLQAAVDQLNRGNNTAATNQLNTFINQVNALVGAGRLPASDGQSLIDTLKTGHRPDLGRADALGPPCWLWRLSPFRPPVPP